MLIFNIRGENIEVTQAIRDYVEKRISKLEKYFEKDMKNTAHVNLRVYPDKQAKVEVTIPLPYLTLRAEEVSNDLYASVDLVTDKLERQIRKYKTKVNRKSREKGFKNLEFIPNETQPADDSDDESKFDVVRTKRLALKRWTTKRRSCKWICWVMTSSFMKMRILPALTLFTVVMTAATV